MIVDLIYKEEVYNIIGLYMEVHRLLGKGFSEIVYKDAIEYECQQKELIYYREKEFLVHYKDIILPHNISLIL
jgi:GxxExxY protein